jgi:hypothetical protein
MPRGDKSTYTDKQKRQAEHIEEGYEKRGVPGDEAARRAWATVNKMTGGGKKSGSGRGKKINTAPAKKGGHKGGAASAARSFTDDGPSQPFAQRYPRIYAAAWGSERGGDYTRWTAHGYCRAAGYRTLPGTCRTATPGQISGAGRNATCRNGL